MDLVSQVSRLVPESGSCLGGKAETTEKTEERKCGWVVSTLWFEGEDKKPDMENLNTGASLSEEKRSIAECGAEICERVMLEDEEVSPVEGPGLYSWFVVTIVMPRSNTAMPHPDTAEHKMVK